MIKNNYTLKVLQELKQLTDQCSKHSSTIMKKQIILKFKFTKNILKLIYDPLYIFNITGDKVSNFEKDFETGLNYKDIFVLLYDLYSRKITGDLASMCCVEFIWQYEEYEDIIIKILNKDLKCGINTKTINAVYKDLIPEFSVPLAKDYKKGLCDFNKENWYASRKLDGVRCLCFIDDHGNINLYSRNGKKFFTLNKIKEDLKNNFKYRNFILDGEICITDENNNENFQSVMKEIRRKNHTIKNPTFFVFDFYTIDEFKNKKILTPYSKYKDIDEYLINCDHVTPLVQLKIESKEKLIKLIKTIPKQWEGLILRKHPTLFKRSNNLLKIKKFKETELKVIDIVKGEKLITNCYQKCVTALVCIYKNTTLNVGSGLTDQLRLYWYNNKTKIINKFITVKYFEESKDKMGKVSLRFPIYKGVRDYD